MRYCIFICTVLIMSSCSTAEGLKKSENVAEEKSQSCDQNNAPKYDGCNSCRCMDGDWICTAMSCTESLSCFWEPPDTSIKPFKISGQCKNDKIRATNLRVKLTPYLAKQSGVTATMETGQAVEVYQWEKNSEIGFADNDVFQVGSPVSLAVSYETEGVTVNGATTTHHLKGTPTCGLAIEKGNELFIVKNLPADFKINQMIYGIALASAPAEICPDMPAVQLVMFTDKNCPIVGTPHYDNYLSTGDYLYEDSLKDPEQASIRHCFFTVEEALAAGFKERQTVLNP